MTITEETHPDYVISSSRWVRSGEFEIDGISFKSMFNIRVNPYEKTCSYYYLLDELKLSPTLLRTYPTGDTQLYPTEVDFQIDATQVDGTLRLTFIYLKVDKTHCYADSRLRIELDGALWDSLTPADGIEHHYFDPDFPECLTDPSYVDESDGATFKFVKEFDIDQIPEGEIIFRFSLDRKSRVSDDLSSSGDLSWYSYGGFSWVKLNESSVTVTIKQNLDHIMYSQVREDSTGVFTIYDVPMIKESFMNALTETQRNAFVMQVFNKFTSVNLEEYRMLTDFVNMKVANTTGYVKNMLYNKYTTDPVYSIDPTSIPDITLPAFTVEPKHPKRFLITKSINPWSSSHGRNKGGFIAHYSDNGVWVFENLVVDDIIYITSELKKYVWNGETAIYPILPIPLYINISIWIDRSFSTSESSVVNNVKTTLVDLLYSKFGYDKPLYISEITKVVQGIPGVLHCKVLEPQHDIFFNFDPDKDFTQEQLIRYTPDLIYFDTNNIKVVVLD